jgi:hypothetical protein
MWEEQFVENQRRRGAVQEEIVPFDGSADQAGRRDRDMRWPFCCQLPGHFAPILIIANSGI